MTVGTNLMTKSLHGTKNMERNEQKTSKTLPKPFSSSEICRIIKLCRKNKVAEMKLGDFEVSFHSDEKPLPKVRSQSHVDLPKTNTVTVTTSKPVVGKTESEFGIQDQRELRELEAAQQLIDDPVGYEQEEIDAAINGSQMVTVNEAERHW